MASCKTESPLADLEFLVRSDHRVTALEALAERPRSRADLRELTGASSSTVGRLLREFEARQWIVRDGPRYESTALGAFVAAGLRELLDRIETERKLRDVWEWLPDEASAITVEMGADAVVTVAETDDPYGPINRFAALLRTADRFRFVGSDLGLLEPCKDDLRDRILAGMEAVIVDPPAVARHIQSRYGDHCAGPIASGNLEVLVHDELPACGIGIVDRRVAIACYNPTSGTVRALIDTDAPAAREWAEATFDAYRREARPFALGTPA
ncbi:helix-turn-helix transcriptional regulator [Natronolimnohabitans innermongolicus]|uniref:Transcriptional regulator-like protein n=1 Tax=Natronolimnohabitans innermongolicus JCM 12255 TaxID=1227499 RepID=L9XAJ1_9EURY|nr:hypothetical protein [Natronolimnohabitans innermongolicus]ELY58652.1 transcriptional regulator-like protein [Natronolimnohabitans innermongolicus JCM 12255]